MEHGKLLIGCIHRSESGSSDNNCKLDELLKEVHKKGYSHILIMGDFNYKGIIWKNWSTPGLSESSEEFFFVGILRDCYFTNILHNQPESDMIRSHQYLIW